MGMIILEESKDFLQQREGKNGMTVTRDLNIFLKYFLRDLFAPVFRMIYSSVVKNNNVRICELMYLKYNQ